MAFFFAESSRRHLQDFGGALVDCTEALQLDPKHVDALCNRGLAKLRLQDFGGAVVDCTEALKLDPKWELHLHRQYVAPML